MKSPPLPIIVVSVLFIVTGCVGVAYHVQDYFEPHDKLVDLTWVLFLRILAIVCGVLLLLRISWARWLAISWLVYHIIISAFNSTPEMIAHIVLLVIVSVLLFLRVSSAYFSNKAETITRNETR